MCDISFGDSATPVTEVGLKCKVNSCNDAGKDSSEIKRLMSGSLPFFAGKTQEDNNEKEALRR